MPSNHTSPGISRRKLLHRVGAAAVVSYLAVPVPAAGQAKRGWSPA